MGLLNFTKKSRKQGQIKNQKLFPLTHHIPSSQYTEKIYTSPSSRDLKLETSILEVQEMSLMNDIMNELDSTQPTQNHQVKKPKPLLNFDKPLSSPNALELQNKSPPLSPHPLTAFTENQQPPNQAMDRMKERHRLETRRSLQVPDPIKKPRPLVQSQSFSFPMATNRQANPQLVRSTSSLLNNNLLYPASQPITPTPERLKHSTSFRIQNNPPTEGEIFPLTRSMSVYPNITHDIIQKQIAFQQQHIHRQLDIQQQHIHHQLEMKQQQLQKQLELQQQQILLQQQHQQKLQQHLEYQQQKLEQQQIELQQQKLEQQKALQVQWSSQHPVPTEVIKAPLYERKQKPVPLELEFSNSSASTLTANDEDIVSIRLPAPLKQELQKMRLRRTPYSVPDLTVFSKPELDYDDSYWQTIQLSTNEKKEETKLSQQDSLPLKLNRNETFGIPMLSEKVQVYKASLYSKPTQSSKVKSKKNSHTHTCSISHSSSYYSSLDQISQNNQHKNHHKNHHHHHHHHHCKHKTQVV